MIFDDDCQIDKDDAGECHDQMKDENRKRYRCFLFKSADFPHDLFQDTIVTWSLRPLLVPIRFVPQELWKAEELWISQSSRLDYDHFVKHGNAMMSQEGLYAHIY